MIEAPVVPADLHDGIRGFVDGRKIGWLRRRVAVAERSDAK